MDIKKRLGVAFLWHMHQPFYKDRLKGTYMMPWARLHGIKDYYPMAALVEKFDDLKVTFNLVPSLVEQINDYVKNDATDTFLDLTVKKAGSLSLSEKIEILNNFFKVNFRRFIEPNPRYSELLIKKGLRPLSGHALKEAIKGFSDSDFLDLQVLFNLAWIHSLNMDEDINLKEIAAQKKGWTEEDKEYILFKQKEILARILPLYKKLQEDGRIEITTTPYYHPILPLICDTSVARISSPGAPLPKRRFSHKEDAAWQIEEAIRCHTEQFGSAPRGMWPSEGSVSDEALDLMIAKGIDYFAADEDILFNSLSLYDKQYKDIKLFDRRIIYRPYKFKRSSRHISAIFRDKNLSDMISFSYNSWNPGEAAWDLIGHIKKISENLRRDTDKGLLTIVMDGENAWEYYEDNGRKFFETLYSNIDKQENCSSTTISEFLDIEPPRRTITNVFPGSWINHNFGIWIGEEQDNLSWEYLDRTRRDLVKFTAEFHKASGRIDGSMVKEAWRELYIAEGSDWNWWYGGKAHTGADNPFDKLYRTHLKNIYKLLKKPIPDFLKISIA
ncbi:MAG: glycoside hydrolase family 57 protein [Candidatus Omnitrophota bacterium]|nr:glycoside hydrolase family 57 protein [Candidatus Omnitrophota bacterium]